MMCEMCHDTGQRQIQVERVTARGRGVHGTVPATRMVPCTDCGEFVRQQRSTWNIEAERRRQRTYPMLSDAMGVHPTQIKEAMELDRKLGVRVSYSDDGRVVYPDAKTRREHCQAHGFYDRNGGASDPQRGKCKAANDPEYRAWCEAR